MQLLATYPHTHTKDMLRLLQGFRSSCAWAVHWHYLEILVAE